MRIMGERPGKRSAPAPRRAALLLLAGLTLGCGAPRVTREAEIERFRQETQARFAGLALDPARPLTLADCEALALKNNLAYRTRLLQARLTDEQVRLAMTGWLPRAEAQFTHTARSNEPLVSVGGAPAMAFEDQQASRFSLRAVIPVFDFGTTYYAYQIAKDRRTQERLAVLRAAQTLRRDVRVQYAQYAAQQRQTRLWETAVQAAQELLKVARSFEREQLGSAADTAQAEALIAQAAKELLLARSRIQETRVLLAQTLSLPPRQEFSIDSALPALPALPGAEQFTALAERALKARPELYVQDLERHVAASAVRSEIAGFFPRLDGLVSFDWSSLSQQVNPAYFTFGFQVAHSLLEGGSRFFRLSEARQRGKVEEERALLLALGILYEIELRALQLATAHNNVLASEKVASAHEVVLKQVASRYREELESGAEMVRAVAAYHAALLTLDRARADYLVAWYELAAAAMPDEGAPDQTRPSDGTAPALDAPAPAAPDAPSGTNTPEGRD